MKERKIEESLKSPLQAANVTFTTSCSATDEYKMSKIQTNEKSSIIRHIIIPRDMKNHY